MIFLGLFLLAAGFVLGLICVTNSYEKDHATNTFELELTPLQATGLIAATVSMLVGVVLCVVAVIVTLYEVLAA